MNCYLKTNLFVCGIFFAFSSPSMSIDLDDDFEIVGGECSFFSPRSVSIEDDFEIVKGKCSVAEGNRLTPNQSPSPLRRVANTVGNIFQRPVGERMAPSALMRNLSNALSLSDRKSWTPSKETFDSGTADIGRLPFFWEHNDAKVIVTSPIHDVPGEETPPKALGCLSAQKLFSTLPKKQDQFDVYVPVAQCDPYVLGIIEKNHWVLLKANLNYGKISKGTLYNSTGSDIFYGGAGRLARQLECPIELECTGDQGTFNNTDCGRFVISYIYHWVHKGRSPSLLSTEEALAFPKEE